MDKISDLKNTILSTLDSNKALDIISIDLANKSYNLLTIEEAWGRLEQ